MADPPPLYQEDAQTRLESALGALAERPLGGLMRALTRLCAAPVVPTSSVVDADDYWARIHTTDIKSFLGRDVK